MLSRRALLVALGAGLTGCSSQPEEVDHRETVTPVGVPEETLAPETVVEIGHSRFALEEPCPGETVCFHRLEAGDEPEAVLLPGQEAFGPESTDETFWIRNASDDELFVDVGWELLKYTGHRWVTVRAPQVSRSGIVTVEPSETWQRPHSIRRVFGLPTLGPGLYARRESVRFEAGVITTRPPIAALFEVEGTTFELRPRRQATVADGVARVETRGSATELVVERADRSVEPTVLVPEVVGAIPVFRDSIPHLEVAPEVRIESSSARLALEYLSASTVRDVEVGAGDPVTFGDRVFRVRIED